MLTMAFLGVYAIICLCLLHYGSGRKTGKTLDEKIDDWELIFVGVARSNKSMQSHWSVGRSPAQCTSTNGCVKSDSGIKLGSVPPDSHLKHIMVDKWICLNVKWVKIEVHAKGASSRLAYFIFNGTESSRDGWLDDDRLMESTYLDLNEDTCFTHHSISGSWFKRFLIGTKKDANNYCYTRRGWLYVIDYTPSHLYMQKCDWIKKEYGNSSTYPHVLYAKGNTNTVWENREFGHADYLHIYVSRTKWGVKLS